MDIATNLASANDREPSLAAQWRSQWIGGIGLLTLLAFTWLPNSYNYMVGWPYILIWQGAFFILGIYTIRVCRQFSIPFGRLGYGLDGVVALTIFVATLSTLNAQFRAVACWNLLLIINYAVCLYLLVNWLRYGKLTRHLLWAMLSVTGIVTSIISLALWRPNVSMWLSQDFNAAIRNAQPLGHHNFVGGYELLLLPIVGSFMLSQQGWRRKVGIVATGIVAIALYASGSRGALVGAIAMGLVSIGLGLLFSAKHDRRQWAIASCCLLLIMGLALASNPRVRTLFHTAPAAEENASSIISLSDGPAKDRVFMLEATHNILKAHPILGVGPGNLSRVYDLYRPIETGAGLSLVQQMHNTPAQLAAELGILGLGIYFVLLATLLRLCILLHSAVNDQHDRVLLYGIGTSWFGYGVSSLSDYQLENIGISITLIITIALLVSLGDAHRSTRESVNLSNRTRRISSICILVLLCGNFQLWTRADVSIYLSYAAIKNEQELALVSADEKLAKAAKLSPWDPTYSALAAETMLNIAKGTKSPKGLQELNASAISYFKEAIKAAPNDTWFNQNLAALLVDKDAREAEKYAKKAALLAPRSYNAYTYYTLGIAYLKQDKITEATDAFVLESLINPIFLTATLWEESPFSDLRESVLEKALDGCQQILLKTRSQSGQYQWLHEQWTILSWWYDRSISEQDLEATTDLVHAILIADKDSKKALSLIDKYIEAHGYSSDLHLIQARLAPEQYLQSLLLELNGTNDEKSHLEQSIMSKKSMKSWFNEVSDSLQSSVRYGGSFAYRNLAANYIQKVLYPGNIEVGILPNSIGFFADAPREYPQLDQYLATARAEKLKIEKS